MNKEYSLIIFYAVIFVLALIGVFLVELPGFWQGFANGALIICPLMIVWLTWKMYSGKDR